MKDCLPKIDELLIDELVSGQLTGERYRAALRAFEAEPAKWRDCALAFLEEQALRSELRAMARGTINWNDNLTENSPVENAVSVVVNPQQSLEDTVTLATRPSNPSGAGFRNLLSTAALLLVSFTVGWLGSEVLAERERIAPVDSVANSELRNSSNTPSAMSPKLDTQFVVDSPGSFDHGIPRAILELQRRGALSVDTLDMVVPTTRDDGSLVVVPVQQMTLRRSIPTSY